MTSEELSSHFPTLEAADRLAVEHDQHPQPLSNRGHDLEATHGLVELHTNDGEMQDVSAVFDQALEEVAIDWMLRTRDYVIQISGLAPDARVGLVRGFGPAPRWLPPHPLPPPLSPTNLIRSPLSANGIWMLGSAAGTNATSKPALLLACDKPPG